MEQKSPAIKKLLLDIPQTYYIRCEANDRQFGGNYGITSTEKNYDNWSKKTKKIMAWVQDVTVYTAAVVDDPAENNNNMHARATWRKS